MRSMRQYTLLHPDDCDAPHGLDLSAGSRDSLKVERLEKAFRESGFDPSEPALIGYPKDGRVQLLTGTHRHEAAKRANIELPVTLFLRSLVEATWGRWDEWLALVKDIPVKELDCFPMPDHGKQPKLEDRVSVDWR